MKTRIKTGTEINSMRDAGRILATTLKVVAGHVRPGISTKELADIAASELKSLGGKPSFLGHHGFPDVLCTSVNDEVVHGIPLKDRILNSGDLIGLDLGVTYKGMITDSAITLIVGQSASSTHKKLVTITEQAMYAGIKVVRDKVRTGDIGFAIESVLKPHHYGIIRDLVGHGVGHELWEEPNIPNYGKPDTGPWLYSGMTIAIEPMVSLGTDQVSFDDDGWTIRTLDGAWCAHFEHTVLILDDGVEILTQL